jgi:predicted ribonuclease toxin of YeeF-YezG toxin-antitoxin module
VWDRAKAADGNVYDPLTGRQMDFDEPWDMGHKPGYEFRKHRESARRRGIDRKQFLEEYNNPDHYRPELPSSNQGHAGEDMSDTYLEP